MVTCPTCDGFRTIACGEQIIPASWFSPAESSDYECTCPECKGAGVVADDSDELTTPSVVALP